MLLNFSESVRFGRDVLLSQTILDFPLVILDWNCFLNLKSKIVFSKIHIPRV